MTTIHELKDSLGLTTGQIIRICGVRTRTVQRWLDGTNPTSPPALRLLALRQEVLAAIEALEGAGRTARHGKAVAARLREALDRQDDQAEG